MASAPIGDTLRQIGRLFAGGAVAGQSDAALLHRFVAEKDEEAFAGLVARHGPMVLAVCRGALRDPGDAEDAFQATFLVLVRRAGSIWVDESLGGWLYRVARRVAVRANAEAMKRKARERQGVVMDSLAGRDEARDRPEAALHDEIARLPEGLRRAVVLCELEGLTQVEAARILHCGEATLRRRLAGARERLRVRLTRQGVATSSIMAMLRPAIVPTGWDEATVRAAMASGRAATSAARLAASVAATMTRAQWLRAAGMLVAGVGLAAAGAFAAHRDEPRKAPTAQAPEAAPERPKPHWAHVTDDIGGETWVCLDDGRKLEKTAEVAILHDPFAGTEMRLDRGEARITRRRAFEFPGGAQPDRAALVELMTHGLDYPDIARQKPGKSPVYGMNAEVAGSLEYAFDTLDGRRCLRRDELMKDPVGEVRLTRQTWIDLETGRPIRDRERLPALLQTQFKREFRTHTYEFTSTGPADLVALGFPKGMPVVDSNPPRPEELPEAFRRELKGAAAAIRRLPRDLRIVARGQGQLDLTYWSCPEPCLNKFADHVIDQNNNDFYGVPRPRTFFANRGDFDHVAGELRPVLPDVPGGDALAELSDRRIAELFPIATSVYQLDDGRREIFVEQGAEPGNPPRDRVTLREGGQGGDVLPKPIADQWPFIAWGRAQVKVVDPEPGTPAGQVVLEMEVQWMRQRWYCDPARDFIAVRRVESHRKDGAWTVSEDSRAVKWKPLPGGTWYVSEWEIRDGGGNAWTRRVEVTPLAPDGFPPDVFDGGKLLESFKKAGAKIVVE